MLMAVVGIESRKPTVELAGIHFTTVRRQGDYFMPRSLYSSRLMHVDMSGVGTYHTVVATCHEVDDSGIGLSASDKKHYIARNFIEPAGLKHKFFRSGGVLVFSVAGSLLHICLRKALKHFGMATAHIICVEM